MNINQVFVVDDDASARRGLTRLLRAAGFDVKDFDSPRSFLDKVDSCSSCCLILDIRMPDMNGEELMSALRTKEMHLPVIFISADDTPETCQMAQNVNASGFFRKPVDGTALIDTIRWTIRTKSRNGSQLEMSADRNNK